jgi:hypothetical protein
MNNKKPLPNAKQLAAKLGCVELPAYPIPGNRIFEAVGAAVTNARGYPLSNLDFARLMRIAPSTSSYWFGVSPQPHLVAFLCLLEHLSPASRLSLLDRLCRDLPRLDHPRLTHAPQQIAELQNLLLQPAGLIWLSGPDLGLQTFVLTALGHSFIRLDARHRKPAGIDICSPHWFVPVESLHYLPDSHRPSDMAAKLQQLWPVVIASQPPLVLLNGVWPILPKLQPEILKIAQHCLVILAGATSAPPIEAACRQALPLFEIVTNNNQTPAGQIRIEIHRHN